MKSAGKVEKTGDTTQAPLWDALRAASDRQVLTAFTRLGGVPTSRNSSNESGYSSAHSPGATNAPHGFALDRRWASNAREALEASGINHGAVVSQLEKLFNSGNPDMVALACRGLACMTREARSSEHA